MSDLAKTCAKTSIAKTSATEIFDTLIASECEIDRALTSSAALLAAMTSARIETASPLATGHTAIMRLVRSLTSLTEARSDMIRVHVDLLKVGQERGDMMMPDGCPKNQVEAPDRGLQLVA